jgi:aspartate/methionine/tyrosine aminotransferase
MTPKTKLVSITNPHNPTGQVIPQVTIRAIVDLVDAHPQARLLVDETYREMTFGGPQPVAATMSERVISVSSLSKADGLPGIRIGWLVTRDAALLERFLAAKEQILITNSVVDEALADAAVARAADWLPEIRARAREARTTVEAWLSRSEMFEWVTPRGGVVGFVRFRPGSRDWGDDRLDRFYAALLERHGTVVGPGHGFEQPRSSFRLGFGWPAPEELSAGLAGLEGAAEEA